MVFIFAIKLPNNKIIQLPSRIKTNEDVYNHLKTITDADLILYYKSIPIPPHPTINLIDIGYDINQLLTLKPFTIKDISFEIINYKYIFTEKVRSYETVYDIKKIFAKHFKTVAQNIIIRHSTQILQDDTNIIDTGSKFEVGVIERFSLYYIHFFNFSFICMPNDSTIQDLKNKLAGFNSLFERGLQFNTDIPDCTNKKIQEIASQSTFLDFKYSSSINVMNTTISIESKDDRKETVYKFKGPFPYLNNFHTEKSRENTIDSMKYFLEKTTHISSHHLFNFDTNTFKFTSSENIYAKVEEKDYTFDYTTTIGHLKELFGPRENKQNVGIIINGRFAQKNSNFLCKYLRAPGNSEKSRMQINLMIPSAPMLLCTFQMEPALKKKCFIVPSCFSFRNIATVYINQNPNLLAFSPGLNQRDGPKPAPLSLRSTLIEANLTEFSVSIKNEFSITYQLDGESKKQSITLQYDNKNPPRIKDLLFKISQLHPHPFHSYGAFIGENRIDFMEFLAEHADQKFIIKSHEHQEGVAESEKCLKVYFAPTNEIVEYKEKINEATTDEIIDKIKNDKGIRNNVSLYLNFMKLSPEDKPIVFSLPFYTLILNEDLPSKEFHIMYFNAIEKKETFNKHYFPMMQAAIQQMFGIQERNNFRLKLDSSSKLYKELPEAVLPFGFDGGSIPNDSLICIDEHEIPETNELTFSYNGRTNTIELSDTNKPIQDLKEEILNELKIYNISQKAVEFKFLNTELNMNKSFHSYGILPKAPITVTHSINSIKVTVRLFDDKKTKDFFFSNGESGNVTNKDAIELIKKEYGRVKLFSDTRSTPLDPGKEIEKYDVIYASFEKVTVRILDPKGEQLKFDEIEVPSESFMLKLASKIRLKPGEFGLFMCVHNGHYSKVSSKEAFNELRETEFFAFRTIKSITLYFKENEIVIHDEGISEFESVQSLIEYFISDRIMAPPKRIQLVVDNAFVNEKETVHNLLQLAEGKKINIELNASASHNSESRAPPPKKAKKKKFMPKTSSVEQSQSTSNEYDDDDEIEEEDSSQMP